MLVRFLLVAVLAGGCSAGTPSLSVPGKSAREAVLLTTRASLSGTGLTTAQQECFVQRVDRGLTDADMQRIDVAGTSDQAFRLVTAAAMSACSGQ